MGEYEDEIIDLNWLESECEDDLEQESDAEEV